MIKIKIISYLFDVNNSFCLWLRLHGMSIKSTLIAVNFIELFQREEVTSRYTDLLTRIIFKYIRNSFFGYRSSNDSGPFVKLLQGRES